MLSIQEMSDRLELQDLLARYSTAVDSRRWDDLDRVFTADAVIDYTEMGAPRGGLTETKAYLAETLPFVAVSQHLTATSTIDVDGDTAVVRSICFNPMVLDTPTGQQVFFCGLWYRDQCVRTPDGWRIRERYEERGYFHNFPGTPPAAIT